MNYICYGVGSPYASEVAEIIYRLGHKVTAFVSNIENARTPTELSPVVGPDEIKKSWLDLPVIIPLVTPVHRKRLHAEVTKLGFHRFAGITDPSAVVASTCTFGRSANINAGVVIGANCNFGHSVLINRSASIGHDAEVGDYVTIGPGSVICGNCQIQPGVFIGAAATICPQVTLARNSIIGAGAVVLNDVPQNCTVVGNPARALKGKGRGYNGCNV